jgi:hypothetical protein
MTIQGIIGGKGGDPYMLRWMRELCYIFIEWARRKELLGGFKAQSVAAVHNLEAEGEPHWSA